MRRPEQESARSVQFLLVLFGGGAFCELECPTKLARAGFDFDYGVPRKGPGRVGALTTTERTGAVTCGG